MEIGQQVKHQCIACGSSEIAHTVPEVAHIQKKSLRERIFGCVDKHNSNPIDTIVIGLIHWCAICVPETVKHGNLISRANYGKAQTDFESPGNFPETD